MKYGKLIAIVLLLFTTGCALVPVQRRPSPHCHYNRWGYVKCYPGVWDQ